MENADAHAPWPAFVSARHQAWRESCQKMFTRHCSCSSEMKRFLLQVHGNKSFPLIPSNDKAAISHVIYIQPSCMEIG